MDTHPLANHALHSYQACPELVLQQLSNGTQASVAKMIYHICFTLAIDQFYYIANGVSNVLYSQMAYIFWDVQFQFFIYLVAPHGSHIVATGVEKEILQKLFSGILGSHFSRAQPSIKLNKSFFLISGGILF